MTEATNLMTTIPIFKAQHNSILSLLEALMLKRARIISEKKLKKRNTR
jgi:hypothetical protein